MNSSLPIWNYRERIIKAVRDNKVTIISGDTRTGKSTEVCQYLYRTGYEVIVAEPRLFMARLHAEYVAESLGVMLGEEVGFITNSGEVNEQEQIIFSNSDLRLIRKLLKRKCEKPRVLIIDEVHEWTLDIEILVAWVRKIIEDGFNIRVVIMSATLESDKLEAFFGDACCITVSGSAYKVEKFQHDAEEFLPTILRMIRSGKNVLAFVPSAGDIRKLINVLRNSKVDAELLPFSSEFLSTERNACFSNYMLPKVVVSTELAQNAITIPGIDAVVDCGIAKRSEVNSYGSTGLVTYEVSKADLEQRAARTGRERDGEYHLCSDTPYESREEYSTSEILLKDLDKVVLKLAAAGMDATTLEFFHQPADSAIKEAVSQLYKLGAIKDGNITKVGLKMEHIPIAPKNARMIVEAEKYGVVEDVITIAAILESGSFINDKTISYSDFSKEKSSDLLIELAIWNHYMNDEIIPELRRYINEQRIFRVFNIRNKILAATDGGWLNISNSHDRIRILKSCLAGMVNNVYRNTGNCYVDMHGRICEIANQSIFHGKKIQFVVGSPYVLRYNDKKGRACEKVIVHMVSLVNTEWLNEVAPHLIETVTGLPEYSPDIGCYASNVTYFNGFEIEREIVPIPNHPDIEELKRRFEEEQQKMRELCRDNARKYRTKMISLPKTVEIDGREFSIDYEKYGGPSITVDKEFLRNVTVRSVRLDDKKTVMLCCGQYCEKTFSALAGRIQQEEINEAFSAKANSLNGMQSEDEKEVIGWFDKLGRIVIAKRWDGRPVSAFVYLKKDGNLIKLELTKDSAIAKIETEEALQFIFWGIIKKKYPKELFEGKSTAKELFEEFVLDAMKSLTAENFIESLDVLHEFFNEIIT